MLPRKFILSLIKNFIINFQPSRFDDTLFHINFQYIEFKNKNFVPLFDPRPRYICNPFATTGDFSAAAKTCSKEIVALTVFIEKKNTYISKESYDTRHLDQIVARNSERKLITFSKNCAPQSSLKIRKLGSETFTF